MVELVVRLLGLVFGLAFASLGVQVKGLVGERGILPARELLPAAREQLGRDAYRRYPTLFWLGVSDRRLVGACVAGVAVSSLLVAGLGPAWVWLLAAWALYLSLVTVGRDFLAFQWDVLLLEAALTFVPLAAAPESPVALALAWWLVARLMFESGVVKLSSGDDAWTQLFALKFHYFTQPLPTPLAWWAHRLPEALQKASVVGTYVVEIALPFLIPFGAYGRLVACAGFCGLMALIVLTGNYGFFNLLTVVLALSLLIPWPDASVLSWVDYGLLVLLVPVLLVTGAQLARAVKPDIETPAWIGAIERRIAPFRSLNGYGLFRVMTRTRPEIEIEGSDDGVTWTPYVFKYKAGDPRRRPPVNQPHQPRLDWQMWFAAMRSFERVFWIQMLMARLLEGEPTVRKLLAKDPFGGKAPRYLRAVRYLYEFSTREERKRSGAWWTRRLVGEYAPVITLRE